MQSGEVVIGRQGQYVIQEELGSGATSRVYRARADSTGQHVALKVLRPNLAPAMQESFFLEADILRQLYDAETRLDDQHAVPFLGEVKRDGEPPLFLVQEIAHGTSIARLLAEPPYYLDEPDALHITAQVCHVLHLLHTELERSYTDFQLKNIFWDPQQRRVMIIDWNHVGDRGKGDPQADLALVGVYLYRMLTGKEALIRGETERALERRAGERWGELSLGARRLVLRALHPSPGKRFQTAAMFRAEAEWLARLWNKEGMELATEASQQLSAETEEGAMRAEVLVDLAQRRGGVRENFLTSLQAKVAERVAALELTWQAGETYYRAGDYAAAAARWQEVAEASGRLEHWRWVQLARAGVKDGRAFGIVKEQVEEALQALGEGDAKRAAQVLDQVRARAPMAALDSLLGEVEARRRVARARQAEEAARYAEAAGAYRRTEDALGQVTYANTLREEEGWDDLAQRAQWLQGKADRAQEVKRRVEQVEQELKSEWGRGVELLRKELIRAPADPAVLEFCLAKGREQLKSGKPERASKILEVGVLWGQGQKVKAARRLWDAALAVAVVQKLLKEGAYLEGAEQALRTATLDDESEVVRQALFPVLFGALTSAAHGGRHDIAENLRQVLEELFPPQDKAHQRIWKHVSQQLNKLYAPVRKQIEDHISKAEKYTKKETVKVRGKGSPQTLLVGFLTLGGYRAARDELRKARDLVPVSQHEWRDEVLKNLQKVEHVLDRAEPLEEQYQRACKNAAWDEAMEALKNLQGLGLDGNTADERYADLLKEALRARQGAIKRQLEHALGEADQALAHARSIEDFKFVDNLYRRAKALANQSGHSHAVNLQKAHRLALAARDNIGEVQTKVKEAQQAYEKAQGQDDKADRLSLLIQARRLCHEALGLHPKQVDAGELMVGVNRDIAEEGIQAFKGLADMVVYAGELQRNHIVRNLLEDVKVLNLPLDEAEEERQRILSDLRSRYLSLK